MLYFHPSVLKEPLGFWKVLDQGYSVLVTNGVVFRAYMTHTDWEVS